MNMLFHLRMAESLSCTAAVCQLLVDRGVDRNYFAAVIISLLSAGLECAIQAI